MQERPKLVQWAQAGKCAHCNHPTPLVDPEITIYCCSPACQEQIRLATKPTKVRVMVHEYRGNTYNKRSKNLFLYGASFDDVVKKIETAVGDLRKQQRQLLPTGGQDGTESK
jgi:hypothetical protein